MLGDDSLLVEILDKIMVFVRDFGIRAAAVRIKRVTAGKGHVWILFPATSWGIRSNDTSKDPLVQSQW